MHKIVDTNIEKNLRADFPLLRRKINGKPLVYLDNAATTQKPKCVIEAMDKYYTTSNANVHRGVYLLSEEATSMYEATREKARKFINAGSPKEIIFTSGATEAINLITYSYGRDNLNAGDEVLITEMEHHANIVPWQVLCREKKAVLRVIPIFDSGELNLDALSEMLNEKTKILSVTHVSNTLGSINPLKTITSLAHKNGTIVVIDGAQGVPHIRADVREIDCDFYVFSGHKMYGPTGIGILYGKKKLLEEMVPYKTGGDMIKSVTFEKTIYNDIPFRFEAGTPNIAGASGLAAAIDYIENTGYEKIEELENELLSYTTEKMKQINGLTIIGEAKEKAAVISFILEKIHPHDIGTILDSEGIAIRTGHHCTQPLMDRYKIPATARASFSFYNTKEEADILIKGLDKVMKVME